MAVAGVLCSAAPNPTGATIAWRKVSAGPTTPPQGTPAWDRLASQGALVADGYDGYGSVVEQYVSFKKYIDTRVSRADLAEHHNALTGRNLLMERDSCSLCVCEQGDSCYCSQTQGGSACYHDSRASWDYTLHQRSFQ